MGIKCNKNENRKPEAGILRCYLIAKSGEVLEMFFQMIYNVWFSKNSTGNVS